MATVQLADVKYFENFMGAVQERAIELNRFVQSGVMTTDPTIDAEANGQGNIVNLSFYHGLDNNEPNYSTDDPAQTSTPDKITSGQQIAISAYMNKSWSTMDLARELALQDPMGAIVNRVGKYWAVNTEKRLLNSMLGVLADNIANDNSDMVNAIHTEDGNNATTANLISAPAVIDTAATMGDHAQELSIIAMHSVVYARLQKLNLIDYIPDARGEVNIPTYLGYRVVVDDVLAPRSGTTSGYVYTTLLFAANSVAYGQGLPPVPYEVERKPDAGNGGGQDILYTRQTEIIHPWGFAVDPTAITSGTITPNLADLKLSAFWNRVYAERKNVGIAFLTTNG